MAENIIFRDLLDELVGSVRSTSILLRPDYKIQEFHSVTQIDSLAPGNSDIPFDFVPQQHRDKTTTKQKIVFDHMPLHGSSVFIILKCKVSFNKQNIYFGLALM